MKKKEEGIKVEYRHAFSTINKEEKANTNTESKEKDTQGYLKSTERRGRRIRNMNNTTSIAVSSCTVLFARTFFRSFVFFLSSGFFFSLLQFAAVVVA